MKPQKPFAWVGEVEAQMRRELLGETLVSDEEAREARLILGRLDAQGDPYAMHRVLENFLRNRRTREATPGGASP